MVVVLSRGGVRTKEGTMAGSEGLLSLGRVCQITRLAIAATCFSEAFFRRAKRKITTLSLWSVPTASNNNF